MYYGWKIIGVTYLTQFVAVGFNFYSYGVFFKTIAAEFSGGSRFGVAIGFALLNGTQGILAPFLGRALDHYSIRNIMCAGALLMATGFLLISRIQTLWQFYAVLGTFIGAGASMMGPIPSSKLIVNWFLARRGTALGIGTMGISMAGLIMAPVASIMILDLGWRTTFVIYGLATYLVVPAIWLYVINRPEDIGMLPDGYVPEPVPSSGGGEASAVGASVALSLAHRYANEVPSTREFLANPNFWAISMTIGLCFCANGAILTHIVPHATDLGYPPTSAALVLSAIAGVGVLGKVVFGWIADQYDKRGALWLALAFQATGVYMLIHATSYRGLILSGGVFGMGMGGMMPLWSSLVSAAFGRHAYGSAIGLMSPCMMPLQLLGVPFAGYVFDRTGSYLTSFRTLLGCFFAAVIILFFLRLPEVEPDSERPTPAQEGVG